MTPLAQHILNRSAAFVAIVLVPLALWAAVPLSSGATSQSQVQSSLDHARSQETALSSQAAAFGRLADQLAGDIAILQRRQAQVAAELAVRRAQLARDRAALARERTRLARLRKRLTFSRRVLSRRLVELYKAGRPDLITVIFESKGFADLLERRSFLERINDQDKRIVAAVRIARARSARETHRLGKIEARAQTAADAVQKQSDALASMHQALAAKQAALAQARAARLAALHATSARRRKLESELQKLTSQQTSGATNFGSWAIPFVIVNCESGGQNLPPNSAGASGYYQIIPSTWSGFGGHGPAAYLASKAEQDRVASLIWNHSLGVGNWDCAAIVHYH